MDDDPLLPGWQCVSATGDPEIVSHMPENHGIQAQLIGLRLTGERYLQDTVRVRDVDVQRRCRS
jgi:hypothetical protein